MRGVLALLFAFVAIGELAAALDDRAGADVHFDLVIALISGCAAGATVYLKR